MLQLNINVRAFLYLLWVSTFLHELGDWHAACAFPFVGGWWCGRGVLWGCGGVSLRAGGSLWFFTGLFSSPCGEVGPLAGHRKSILTEAGQNLRLDVPAASVGGALLISSVALHQALHLYSDERGKENSLDIKVKDVFSNEMHWML